MRRLPLAFALMMLASMATAQVYKWTDSHGTVHYSETPPPTGTHFSKLNSVGLQQNTANAKPPAATARERAPAPSSTAPVPDTPQNRKALCQSLQSNINVLQSKGPVQIQDNGKATALDETQRDQQIAEAQAQMQQYCSQ